MMSTPECSHPIIILRSEEVCAIDESCKSMYFGGHHQSVALSCGIDTLAQ